MKYLFLLLPFFASGQTISHTAPPRFISGGLFTKTDTFPFAGGIINYPNITSTIGFIAKDFDYTVYTTHALITIDNTDSLHELTLHRKISKEANILKIISLSNTADCITYNLHYIGFQSDSCQLVYTNDAQETIYINPMIPVITIGRTKYY